MGEYTVIGIFRGVLRVQALPEQMFYSYYSLKCRKIDQVRDKKEKQKLPKYFSDVVPGELVSVENVESENSMTI